MKRIFILALILFTVGYLLLSNLFISTYHLPPPAISDSVVHYSTVLWIQNESVGCFTNETMYPYQYTLWHKIIGLNDRFNGLPLPWTITLFNLAVVLGIFILVYLIGREYDIKGAWLIGCVAFGVSGDLIRNSWPLVLVFALSLFSLYLIMKVPVGKYTGKRYVKLFASIFILCIVAEQVHRFGCVFVILWLPILLARTRPEKKIILEMIVAVLVMIATSLLLIKVDTGARLMVFVSLLFGIYIWRILEWGIPRIKLSGKWKKVIPIFISIFLVIVIILPQFIVSMKLVVPREPEFLDILKTFDRGELTSDSYVALYDSELDDSKGRGYGCAYLVSLTKARVEIVGKNPSHIYEPVLRAQGGFTAWDEWNG